jgi:hypothetical protein
MVLSTNLEGHCWRTLATVNKIKMDQTATFKTRHSGIVARTEQISQKTHKCKDNFMKAIRRRKSEWECSHNIASCPNHSSTLCGGTLCHKTRVTRNWRNWRYWPAVYKTGETGETGDTGQQCIKLETLEKPWRKWRSHSSSIHGGAAMITHNFKNLFHC